MQAPVRVVCLAAAAIGLSACMQESADAPRQPANTPVAATDDAAQGRRHLETFDDLDFNVYSGQKWDEFHRSHAEDIVVHYPDGHTTTGLAAHLEDLKPQFEFAPDTKIRVHPLKLAQGDLTAVMGVMEGTFSKPMKLPDGTVIQPTNKPFKLDMATFGRWRNGVMVEEWLFFDSQAFMKQIGLAK